MFPIPLRLFHLIHAAERNAAQAAQQNFFSEVALDRSRRRVFSRVSSSDVVDSSKAELSGLDGGLFCCTSRVSTGGLATSDVPLRSEISVSNRSIICFCSSATCWSHGIICEWPSGWLCGKRLRGAERHEHGLRVCLWAGITVFGGAQRETTVAYKNR